LLFHDVCSEAQFLLLGARLLGQALDDGVASGNFGGGGLELLFSVFSASFEVFPQIRISLTSFVRELPSSVGALHRVLGIFRPLF
jgi:hypothetical protein